MAIARILVVCGGLRARELFAWSKTAGRGCVMIWFGDSDQ
jgi:hypothetical protein